MKFVRFDFQNRTSYGLLEGDTIKAIQGDIFSYYQVIDRVYPLADCKLLPPCQPSKIFGVGLNYKDLDRYKGGPSTYPPIPGVFMIPPTGLIGAGDEIVYPHRDQVKAFVVRNTSVDTPIFRSGSLMSNCPQPPNSFGGIGGGM
ncbi:MAG: DUF2437 domain-containing protein, partial [Candidatus Poribacteria bacterium]|nr:DUF2437 domain-containing protein [Candidatus Poribacteria bacterium]